MSTSDPPGYRETVDLMKRPAYGWGVLVGRSQGGGDTLAIVTVRDWNKARLEMPYKWLNVHKNQPAPVDQTRKLCEETWQNLKKAQDR